MDPLLDRFCRYVRIDTQADEKASSYPSSAGQLELGRLLLGELKELGIADAVQDEHGIVIGTVPGNVKHQAPTIALIAHLDTSPDASGRGVKPIVHANYDGNDIVLPGDPKQVIRVADTPALKGLVGKTLVTTDGTTLLGADDKAGVAVIMETVAYLQAHSDVPHGPIRIVFTCDEEIGRGVDYAHPAKIDAIVGYTLDGGGTSEIDCETFSADLAVVTITGVSIHPGMAKDSMVNAVRLAAEFVHRLPSHSLSPETTSDRQGFLHPYRIEGAVGSATVRILLRDFASPALADQAQLLEQIAAVLRAEYPRAKFDIAVTPQYRNMAEGLVNEPRAVVLAEQAMREVGLVPRRTIVRGGTDGSRLTELGLPTPNLSTGEHNLHSPLEFTCLEEMRIAVHVAVELARLWGKEIAA